MQIDLMPGATPSVASAVESAATSPEPEKAFGSFADLLDAVADDPDDPTPADHEADEGDLDPWLTVPVVVPVVPVIPQGIVEITDEGATSVEAIGGAIASVDVDVPVADVSTSIDVKPFVADKAPKQEEPKLVELKPVEPKPVEPKPVEPKPVDTSAAHEAPASSHAVVDTQPPDVVEDVHPYVAEPDAVIATTPGVAPKEPVKAEPTATPKSGKASRTAPESKPHDVVEASKTAADAVRSAMQSVVVDSDSPRVEASPNTTPDDPSPSLKGVSARFARAIEREMEHAAAPAIATGENSQSSNQNSDGQPSLGEWLREQLPQLTAARGHNSATPAWSFVAPAQHETRVSGVPAANGGSLMPNAPAMPNEHDVTMQLVQSMRMQFRDGIGEAILKLKPEHLGAVSISLRVENGGLKANVQADMPAVRQWLESQQDTLRSALADHGLRLDRFDVEPDAQRQRSDAHDAREQSRKRHSQKREAEEPVFEVVV
jgi:flagellar hook-length control protein FliK